MRAEGILIRDKLSVELKAYVSVYRVLEKAADAFSRRTAMTDDLSEPTDNRAAGSRSVICRSRRFKHRTATSAIGRFRSDAHLAQSRRPDLLAALPRPSLVTEKQAAMFSPLTLISQYCGAYQYQW